MESINDNRTTQCTNNNTNLTQLVADPERILQSAASPSFRKLYKSPGMRTQERKTIDTLEHTLETNNGATSQDPLSENARAHRPSCLTKSLSCYAENGKKRSRPIWLSPNASVHSKNCRKSPFGHFPDGIWIAQRRLERQLLRAYRACLSKNGSQRSVVQLVRSKHRGIDAALDLYERFYTCSSNILRDCPPGCKVYPWDP